MKRLFNTGGLLVLGVVAQIAVAEVHEFDARSEITKASAWLGHHVVTIEGEELGKVEDLAIDRANGRVAYVVVSIASYLIDESLIAVHADALLPMADSQDLLLNTDQDLQTVARFTDDRWPLKASVLPSDTAPQVIASTEDRSAQPEQEAQAAGTATITGLTRTATLSAGERRITSIELPIATPTLRVPPEPAYDGPPTEFDRLDADGNGSLSRREIAHQLTGNDRYTEVDEDDDGGVDRFEYDLLIERQARDQ